MTKPAQPKNKKSNNEQPPLSARQEISEFTKTALVAVFLAVLIRTFLYEPFNIPSGSMLPTLLVGDYLFVNKPAYGYSRHSFPFSLAPLEGRVWDEQPQRGDVIVFKLPSNTSIDYIKRVVGLPGDRIQVRDGRLYINDKIIPREYVRTVELTSQTGEKQPMQEYAVTLPGGVTHRIYEEADDRPLDDTDLYEIPAGHYFVMGDNRDNSQDSRVAQSVGFVPFENIVGEADFIFFSTNGYAKLLQVWKWPWTVRYERFFQDIGPEEQTSRSPSKSRSSLSSPAMARE